MSKVIPLHRRRPDEALERLNRLTGLDFRRWPESLLPAGDQDRTLSASAGERRRPR